MKKIVILGATGSIGTNTLDIISRFPDQFQVVGLTAKSSDARLEEIINTFHPKVVSLQNEKSAASLASRLNDSTVEIMAGEEGAVEVARFPEADLVISGIVGAAGLFPTLSAIRAGKTVALANKETMVMAGEIVQREAQAHKVSILPIDSEHSAIFQVLSGERHDDIKRIILTASGGPLLGYSEQMKQKVTPEVALAHPNWKMGPKISIDSATMMNKGLEIIEARWLFDLPPEKIDVVIHPQSIVHSLVEFVDRSVIAQMGLPDMRVPISYVLHYPGRSPLSLPSLDLAKIGSLTFEAPDMKGFPLLSAAYDALSGGGTLPSVLNAANEEAVNAFLDEKIAFIEIHKVVRETLESHTPKPAKTLEDVLAADQWARVEGQKWIKRYATC
ncbi:MAG: 1-deoxy-D-xylulose-5-phosphate reductoisomerase [Nitrospiria bacterium]